MEIKRFVSPLLETNCYVVYEGRDCIIVDPAGVTYEILDFLSQKGLSASLIVNTHGHGDHIASNEFFLDHTAAKLAIHAHDASYLEDLDLNLSAFIGEEYSGAKAEVLLSEGSVLPLASSKLTVWHTPGHTPGGICLVGDTFVITGDTLFRGSIGRTDFPGGDMRQMKKSLERLKKLPPAMVVYPGHGQSSTIEKELAENPYM